MGNFYLCEVDYSVETNKHYYYTQANSDIEAQNKVYKYHDEHFLSAMYGELLFCSIYRISEEFKEAVDDGLYPSI